MQVSIPYNGEDHFLQEVLRPDVIGHVKEIYFAGDPAILPSGRRPKIKGAVRKKNGHYYFDRHIYHRQLRELIGFSSVNSISTNLLLNFSGILGKDGLRYVFRLLDMGVDTLTVGNIPLLEQLRKYFPKDIKIQNSVYIRIRTKEDLKLLIRMGISIFLLPPDFNDDFVKIYEFWSITKQNNITFKIMVNEGCIRFCPYRRSDQLASESYTISSTIEDFINNPLEMRTLTQPCRSYMNKNGIRKSNFIHPGNISRYTSFDPYLKIVGREFDNKKISKCLRAYMSGKYDGDLREIVANFKHSVFPVMEYNSDLISFRVSGNEVQL
uniref:Peptidase family U32 n=1 Tax=Candidatus Kentrum sp. LFY TaxID=2126342 RepID=A0A450UEX7_9GAMM|nr:MAG: hypothetical protein BECKLFY1418A_GA0070994_101422 [Candidatus Kentron sp. LFY]VFK19401.1 MAG: hypothetical protein BECKLFY1418C_GA0070996_105719 [Candidatus Kentron sp. LFY]